MELEKYRNSLKLVAILKPKQQQHAEQHPVENA
jgi:hypothetical protein